VRSVSWKIAVLEGGKNNIKALEIRHFDIQSFFVVRILFQYQK